MSLSLSQAKRLRIYERDDYACWYCGLGLAREVVAVDGSFVGNQPFSLLPTLDHLEPRIRGGYDLDSNLVTACRSCNSKKGKKSVEESRRYLSVQLENTNDVAMWIQGKTAVITFWGEVTQQQKPLQLERKIRPIAALSGRVQGSAYRNMKPDNDCNAKSQIR
jgi:hypothetical protein